MVDIEDILNCSEQIDRSVLLRYYGAVLHVRPNDVTGRPMGIDVVCAVLRIILKDENQSVRLVRTICHFFNQLGDSVIVISLLKFLECSRHQLLSRMTPYDRASNQPMIMPGDSLSSHHRRIPVPIPYRARNPSSYCQSRGNRDRLCPRARPVMEKQPEASWRMDRAQPASLVHSVGSKASGRNGNRNCGRSCRPE
jgi:hypothetical protein